MEVKAASKYIRISPRKTRLVADLIRGKNALKARYMLSVMNRRAAKVILKTLNSALSNAKQVEAREEDVFVKKILVDGGPLYKRYMPRAQGRATMIQRPTSHITVVLSDGGVNIKREEDVGKKRVSEIKLKGRKTEGQAEREIKKDKSQKHKESKTKMQKNFKKGKTKDAKTSKQ